MKFPANSMPSTRRAPAEPASEIGKRAAGELIRAAYPALRGEERIKRVARWTGRSEKTVRNWLDGTHEMKLGDALSLRALVGVELFLRIISRG